MSKLFSPLRLVFYITAVLIILTSTWFSNRLAKELSEEEQEKIAMIQAQAQMMQQRANQFLMSDPEIQAAEIGAAQQQLEQVPSE